MKKVFFSKAEGGFYSDEIHGDDIPGDAVEITEEQHRYLINGQSQGKTIVGDKNGFPFLEDATSATWSPEPTIARVRDAREVVLNRLAGIAVAAMAASKPDEVSACLAARDGLLGITSVTDVKSATDEQSLVAALESAYAAIIASAPESVIAAFRDFRF